MLRSRLYLLALLLPAIGTSAASAQSDATYATATVTVVGGENSASYYPCGGGECPTTEYDYGTIYLSVGSVTASTGYQEGSTSATIASALASQFNSSTVSASVNGATITLTARTPGSAGDSITVMGSSATNNTGSYKNATGGYSQLFFNASFGWNPATTNLSGGKDATTTVNFSGTEQYNSTVGWDQGTVTLSINGYIKQVQYGMASTPASIASAFAARFSADSCAPAYAQANNTGGITFYLRKGASLNQLSVHIDSLEGLNSFSAIYGQDGTQPAYPSVTSMNPTGGLPGTIVTLTGTNLLTGGTIDYDGVPLTPSSWTSTQITATVPPGAQSGVFDITNTLGSTSSPLFTIYTPETFPPQDLFAYQIAYTAGYDPVGNLLSYNDTVQGFWSATYDNLNRLLTSTESPVPSGGGTPSGTPSYWYCWSYDDFGNRTGQYTATQAYTTVGDGVCDSPAIAKSVVTTTNSNNQISYTSNGAGGTPSYDSAGNMLSDGVNQYLYDGEGRLCALRSPGTTGGTVTVGYIYNAEGQRVAKGNLTQAFSCDSRVNGFSLVASYAIDLGGGQVTETDQNNNWVHSNVNAPGGIMATYDTYGLHFQISDWLGTRRAQTNYAGTLEMTYGNLPFGDQMTAVANPNCKSVNDCFTEDSTEEHFTGKEWDAESVGANPGGTGWGDLPAGGNAFNGNDYFGARYYSSAQGRWLQPDFSDDPDTVPYADFENPQSLNLYAYVGNDPLVSTDSDGHDCNHPSKWVFYWLGNLAQTGQTDPGPCPDLSLLFDRPAAAVNQAIDATKQAGQAELKYLAAPRNMSCLGAFTIGGAETGAVLGLAGGPAAEVTSPAGFIAGGGAGFTVGMGACMTGGGGGGGGGRASGSEARLTTPQQRQTAEHLGMKEVKGLKSQEQLVFEKNGRYFSFSNTKHMAGEVFKEVDRKGARIFTTDINLNRIGP